METRVTLLLWNPRGEEAGGKLGGMEEGKAPGDLSRETCTFRGAAGVGEAEGDARETVQTLSPDPGWE